MAVLLGFQTVDPTRPLLRQHFVVESLDFAGALFQADRVARAQSGRACVCAQLS